MSQPNTPKPTLDQRRAKHAWEAVQCARNKKSDKFDEFCGHAKQLPMRILAAGLGQALMFLLAKDEAPVLLQATADWILDKRANCQSTQPYPEKDKLILAIINRNADFLRHATDETLAYLRWLVRFTDAAGQAAAAPGKGD